MLMVLCQLDVVSLDSCVLVNEFHLMFVETVALHVMLEKCIISMLVLMFCRQFVYFFSQSPIRKRNYFKY